ncbi:hypothetical protein [Natrarchaeobius chitinivorans]|uniref:hypothetical protein n=1 Tax=Natrarchaeobius chitinivorans TaxID=1679083 RepID=UPI0014055140|nr:hypothetical protein [Natrarchaeobius chitinivorans]
MGLFSKAGKTFEEAKQSYMSGKGATYVCRACEERMTEEHDYCPHCGEDAVEELE